MNDVQKKTRITAGHTEYAKTVKYNDEGKKEEEEESHEAGS